MVKFSSPYAPSTWLIFVCPRTHASLQICHHSASSVLAVQISCRVIKVFVLFTLIVAPNHTSSDAGSASNPVLNLSTKLYRIYACYTNIMLYHVIYSFRYYPRFHVTAVGLGTYYPRMWGTVCIRA